MKHPVNIENYKSLYELSRDIGKMRYDAAAKLLEELAKDLQKQGDADFKRERRILAERLYKTAFVLESAALKMRKAWEICRPYMQEELKQDPEIR